MISIIIPCYNEAESLPILTKKITEILKNANISGEIIVVDDNSPDGTGELAERLKLQYNVKIIHRKRKEGLASAVLSGIEQSSGEIIGVMDADLSHDPEIIPKLTLPLKDKKAQLAVGSRHVKGGGSENWPLIRKIISNAAIFIGKTVTNVKDATSGYFFFRKEIIEGVNLNPAGFKIGLEIFVKANYERFVEVPFIFQNRRYGTSKLGGGEVLHYIAQLASLWIYNFKNKRKKRPMPICEEILK